MCLFILEGVPQGEEDNGDEGEKVGGVALCYNTMGGVSAELTKVDLSLFSTRSPKGVVGVAEAHLKVGSVGGEGVARLWGAEGAAVGSALWLATSVVVVVVPAAAPGGSWLGPAVGPVVGGGGGVRPEARPLVGNGR